jgi:hypothetical protein
MPTNPNMVAIQTVTVGSGGAASIEFTNIPQTYTDLVIKLSARNDRADTQDHTLISFNGSTASITNRQLYAFGTTVGSITSIPRSIGVSNSANGTSNTFSNTEIYIPNYTSANNKSYSADTVSENNTSGDNGLWLTAGLWSNTAAITSVTLTNNIATEYVEYSTATLYGVTSSAYGAKATGGIITSDANYFYHTFIASGTFTPTSNITADYLVVAGGGGGGNGTNQYAYGGGGGAGGLRCTVGATGGGGSLESALSLTASTGYTVTVGAGGSAATQGSNSVFSSITSTGGGAGGGAGNVNGGNGGSGGGGEGSSGNTRTGGTGTASQGYAGGASVTGTPFTGGGGGAGEAGNTDGQGLGGDGVTTSISGLSVTYAGGGTGGFSSVRAGGDGGGGAGGGSGVNATVGTANTGGGGGGATDATGYNTGAAGGSGIVVIRYAK